MPLLFALLKAQAAAWRGERRARSVVAVRAACAEVPCMASRATRGGGSGRRNGREGLGAAV
jgi:hypothetical protein